MKVSSQLKGGIYEVSFGYNTNLGGYTTLMSDIPKLGDIFRKILWRSEKWITEKELNI